MQEVSAGIIIYRRTKEGPKFLLLYHGGRYWNFPKGRIGMRKALARASHSRNPEAEQARYGAGANAPMRIIKESTFQAALREIREETGLSDRDLKFNNWFKTYDRYTFTRRGGKVFKTVVYYLAQTNKKDIKLSHEHSGYGWFLYRDALKMFIYNNSKNNLRKSYETIRGKSVRRRRENPPR